MRITPRFTFFFSARDPFSNWHPAPFRYVHRGVELRFAQTEQFMMWAKAMLFRDEEIARKILLDPNPRSNKRLGRQVRGFDEQTWLQHARRIVYVGNREKYLQNPKLLDALIRTAGTQLVEASPYDCLWGVGLSENDPRIEDPNQWRGRNWLGQVLTHLRDDLLGKQGSQQN